VISWLAPAAPIPRPVPQPRNPGPAWCSYDPDSIAQSDPPAARQV